MSIFQGKVRGEAVTGGDASGGVDVVLYAVTPGWSAIGVDSGMLISCRASSPTIPGLYVTGGDPFTNAMVGSTISITGHGVFEIAEVISPYRISIYGAIEPGTMEEGVTFSMAGQESLQALELDVNDKLRITDVFISQEKDSGYALVEGSDSPGLRLVKGRLLEMGSVNLRFETPYVCQPQSTLKYFGHDNGLNVCLVHGFIT